MFVDEIQQQPGAVRELIEAYRTPAGAAALDRVAALYGQAAAGPALFAGMGSSFYAADAVISRLADGGVDKSVGEAGGRVRCVSGAAPPAGAGVAVGDVGGDTR